ncbi:alpha/beta fold hydrolase [Aestuariivita sp.]|jgi:pimeloyl-ACP methyl ester carboxylesterase|uniref:alpha/beta hydrolase n=1 Tax=Aestuariivita sp. TaxID=1872407 RepID=UPI00216E2B93|nr:alpha/beta fold hydrolase [Aestuariivita sp.]MCE8006642.1 alpha/beta fold hydrolase [Aestuariivita sp.]
MALFFSRRTFNAQQKKFTNNPAALTRYVAITGTNPGGGGWAGGILSRDNWLAQVRQAGGTRDVVIYVHGFNTSQADMLRRMERMETGLRAHGYTGAVVSYDWPSDGSVLNYNRDRSDAKEVAQYLVKDGMVPLLGMSPKPRVHLMAHSMGALVVLRGFSDFGDAIGPGQGAWSADQVIFAAGDVDSVWLERGAWGSLVLNQRSRRFTNYYSGRDRVLALSGGLINGGRERVGHVGMPSLLATGHQDVYCNEQYKKDVPTSDQTMTYSHRWWFDNDGFLQDMALTLSGRAADQMPTRRATNIADQALLV